MTTPVVTRFAPSPTGYLHIGGARTALFNWLYARHFGGKMLLRIEDTDRARSTDDAIEAILDGLRWLGLEWDDDVVYQHTRATRHAEIADQMLASGNAYRCYCSPQELAEMREKARSEGNPVLYDGTWRDRDPADAPAGVDPVIRLKAPRTGETLIDDLVQGPVVTANEQLDDLILLRSDGSPTYMLSVVVDDHDMAVTHVVRGDDHLTNAARQALIYKAMDWPLPEFAHIPLIHGPDGAKLSKRHGALGVDAYRLMGYLPHAMRNYLVRLGWSHGDEEIISLEDMISWFDLNAVGRAPARFDFAKLENLNGHYIRASEDAVLSAAVADLLPDIGQEASMPEALTTEEGRIFVDAMPALKERAKTLVGLAASGAFLFARRPIPMDDKAGQLLTGDARQILARLTVPLGQTEPWTLEAVEAALRDFAERENLKLGQIAQPLRAALTGSTASPGIFDVLALLGRDETLRRIADQAA